MQDLRRRAFSLSQRRGSAPSRLNGLLHRSASTQVTNCLRQALAEGRLVFGIYSCAEALRLEGREITVCLLPEDVVDDEESKCFNVLLQSFCMEREIPVLKTNRRKSIEKFFENESALFDNNNGSSMSLKSPDMSCIMIKNVKNNRNRKEKELISFVENTFPMDGDLPFVSIFS